MAGCWQHTDFRPSVCSSCGGTVFGFDGEDLCFTCVAKDATLASLAGTPATPEARVAGDGCTREEPAVDPSISCKPDKRLVYIVGDNNNREETAKKLDACQQSRYQDSPRRARKKKTASANAATTTATSASPSSMPSSSSPCPRHADPGTPTARCTCSRRQRRVRARRPSPEGLDRYDQVIYAEDPLFSDYGSDGSPECGVGGDEQDRKGESQEEKQAREARESRAIRQRARAELLDPRGSRNQRSHAPESLFSEALQRVSNAGTALKLSIISVELKDVSTALRKLAAAVKFASDRGTPCLDHPPAQQPWHRGAWMESVEREAVHQQLQQMLQHDDQELKLLDEVSVLLKQS